MKVLLSPAKNLRDQIEKKIKDPGQPELLDDSKYLIDKLRKLSKKKIKDLMKISPALAELNYQRYQDWAPPFTEDNAIPAIYIFSGEVYRGMDAMSFTQKELNVAQKKLRILSGLYGIMKPKDLIQPYRLEMGSRLKITASKTGLYQFWGDKLTNNLNEELEEGEVLVNLASSEYFKALDFKKLKARIITCHFKDNKNGVYKTLFAYAKVERGRMASFIVKNNINEAEELKAFEDEGYKFNPGLSTEEDFVFTR